ncbi:T9SS type B sorting domain-containing protein [Aquimarina sp. 2201CG14-23]|uniref:T9SS type B sorting domain-containing protein n=1 Tax=Aquimarina mycalae TaxID=3040073 RepID=UPI002477F279|nr:gliding motility-associated C-terminal domain-containing protein [Aquimarina sp. 2201CG14-23]MDH7446328.1 gliding motility-associated C-terminal domain-containing protein [Aquimarina sp. 2201CG14-23]
MKKIYILVVSIFIMFFMNVESTAQSLSDPEFSFEGSASTTTIVCVLAESSERIAISEYTGPSGFFSAGTTFYLELSDEFGVFQNPPLELATLTINEAITSSQDLIFDPFEMPSELRGEDYSLRIRDENSLIVSVTEGIPIYYIDISGENGISITGPNPLSNNVALCGTGSTTLTAFPVDFAQYTWLYEGSPIPGETTNILDNITQPGTYTVIFESGSCNTPYGGRNRINIEVFNLDQTNVFISEEMADPIEFCPNFVPKQLTCSITDPAYTYEWFLDGEAIADSNTSFLDLPQSNFAGEYTVIVTESEGCSVETNPVEVINLGSDILTQPPPQLIILPEETITLAITTNAPDGSEIQWFENGIEIPGATNLFIDVTAPGMYSVELMTNDLCRATLRAETEVFSPVDFKPTVSQVIDCDDNIATLALEDLFGITAGGLEIPLTTNQYAFFDFEWFRDATTTGETGLTFTVNGINENDSYTLTATFIAGDFPTDTSDPVMIEFLTDDITILSDPPFLPFGGTVTLSVPLSSLYTYEWFTDVSGDFQLIEGETTNMLVVSEEANYRVIITYQDCVVQREISVGDEPGASVVIPNVITPNGSPGVNDNWVLPDEFETSDVQVAIYSSNGKLDFEKSGGYNEDWPSNSASGASELIYYYIITRNSAVVKKRNNYGNALVFCFQIVL